MHSHVVTQHAQCRGLDAATLRVIRWAVVPVALCGALAALAGCAGSQAKPAATPETEQLEAQAEYEANPPPEAQPSASERTGERAGGAEPSLDTPAESQAARASDTARNARDRGTATATPADQSESSSDVELTAEIRRAVMDDESLSFTAKNTKIITENGRVILRGPVESASEKIKLEAHAKRLAGAGNVTSELEIDQ